MNFKTLAATTAILASLSFTAPSYAQTTSKSESSSQPSQCTITNSMNPDCFEHNMEYLKKLLQELGLTGASLWGAFSYYKKQQWNKHQFTSKEFKDFETQLFTKNSWRMLDSVERKIEGNSTWTGPIDDKTLIIALSIPKKGEKTEIHPDSLYAKIRDNFDMFLMGLQRFEAMIQYGVIEAKSLENYLKPWIDFMKDLKNDSDPDRKKVFYTLTKYIAHYKYNGVQALFSRYGVDISYPPKEEKEIEITESLASLRTPRKLSPSTEAGFFKLSPIEIKRFTKTFGKLTRDHFR
ncbi:MAG: hypothetical protein RLZZ338_980 [Cyanobacteriota bacterium]|jgi:hypothetical protein